MEAQNNSKYQQNKGNMLEPIQKLLQLPHV